MKMSVITKKDAAGKLKDGYPKLITALGSAIMALSRAKPHVSLHNIEYDIKVLIQKFTT